MFFTNKKEGPQKISPFTIDWLTTNLDFKKSDIDDIYKLGIQYFIKFNNLPAAQRFNDIMKELKCAPHLRESTVCVLTESEEALLNYKCYGLDLSKPYILPQERGATYPNSKIKVPDSLKRDLSSLKTLQEIFRELESPMNDHDKFKIFFNCFYLAYPKIPSEYVPYSGEKISRTNNDCDGYISENNLIFTDQVLHLIKDNIKFLDNYLKDVSDWNDLYTSFVPMKETDVRDFINVVFRINSIIDNNEYLCRMDLRRVITGINLYDNHIESKNSHSLRIL